MTITTIGVDPGKTGAAALLVDGLFKDHFDYTMDGEVARNLEAWIMLYDIDIVILEKVQARPPKRVKGNIIREGATNSFNFGMNFGYWQGLFDAYSLSWRLVAPPTWQKGLIPKKRNEKDKPSLEVARRLFPGAPLAFKKDHGRADAMLMAYWAYLSMTGGKK